MRPVRLHRAQQTRTTLPKKHKSPFETSPKGPIWRTQEERQPPLKDGESPALLKSGAPSLWPYAAQRAKKRANFRMAERVEVVGNWELEGVRVVRGVGVVVLN